MKVESLSFHLENLLPGIVILYGLLILLPLPPANTQDFISRLQASELLLSVVFLTFAYLIGVISALLSRFIVDNLSELFPRPLFLALSTKVGPQRPYNELKVTLESLAKTSSSSQSIKSEQLKAMGDKESRRIMKKYVREAWNKIYRAALREVSRSSLEQSVTEVQRRREQGRLVRNLFFPLIITPMVLSRLFQVNIDSGWIVLFTCCMGVISIMLYSYAEYFIFAEASLHLSHKSEHFTCFCTAMSNFPPVVSVLRFVADRCLCCGEPGLARA